MHELGSDPTLKFLIRVFAVFRKSSGLKLFLDVLLPRSWLSDPVGCVIRVIPLSFDTSSHCSNLGPSAIIGQSSSTSQRMSVASESYTAEFSRRLIRRWSSAGDTKCYVCVDSGHIKCLLPKLNEGDGVVSL